MYFNQNIWRNHFQRGYFCSSIAKTVNKKIPKYFCMGTKFSCGKQVGKRPLARPGRRWN
jgi:hypothetical protein